METVSFMLGRWATVERTAKDIGTLSPRSLLKDDTAEGRDRFSLALNEKLAEVRADHSSFVTRAFPPGQDTEMSLCVRYSYKTALLALTRLCRAYGDLPFDPSTEETHRYFSTLCIPPRRLYHGKAAVAADLVHHVFLAAATQHLSRLPPENCTNVPLDGLSAEEMPVYYGSSDVDELLQQAVLLDSYPVVPANLAGTLRSTIESSRETAVLAPGVENRVHVTGLSSKRVCVCCKLDNIAVGLTDVAEQATKRPCRCVFDTTPRDEAYVSRATALTRLLLLNARHVPAELGCGCAEHGAVLTQDLLEFKEALEEARVN